MAPLPEQQAQPTRRRRPCILSFTAARDRCLRRRFLSAGLRPFSIRLSSTAGPGTTVHVWAPQRPAPRAVLLLHGFGASATWQWAPYLRKLIAAGLDPIVPGLLFFGASSSPAPDRFAIFQARTVKSAMDAIGVRRFSVVGVSYSAFVAYRMAAMYPEAVERTVMVCAGVCLEESDLSAGLFPVSDAGEAAELLVPRRPAEVRRLVRLTFVRPPPIMPSCFLKDYINVLGSDHIQEKTELLHTLIKDRKLSDLPKIRQVIHRCTATLRTWSTLQRVEHRDLFLEVALRLEAAAKGLFSRHGWQHSLRIDLPPS